MTSSRTSKRHQDIERVTRQAIHLTAKLLFVFRKTPFLETGFLQNARTILLIRPEGMGDLIQTLPGVEYLRRINPQARIAVLVRPLFAQLATDLGVFDQVLSFEYPKLSSLRVFRLWRTLLGFLRLHGKFDLAYDFRGDPRNAIIGAWAAKAVIGIHQDQTSFLLSLSEPDDSSHSVEVQNLAVVSMGQPERPARVTAYETIFAFHLPAHALQTAEQLHARLGDYVIVHPVPSRPNNSYAISRWIELVRRISDVGLKVVLTGGGARDTAVASQIEESIHLPDRVTNLVNRTSPTELAAIVDRALAVVSPDTGIAHIAYARRVPSVTIFGSDTWVKTGYSTPFNLPLQYELPCRPCGTFHCPRTDFPMECTEAISSDLVFSSLMRAISAKAAGTESTS